MASPEEVENLRNLLTDWATKVSGIAESGGIYLFGSLVYRDGNQFVPGSDVDLAILVPADAKNAVERVAWLEKLLPHKVELEKRLADSLGRSRSEPICSVIALTVAEVGADIHKDGAEQFFGNNSFLDLVAGGQHDKFPGAGRQKIQDRLIRQCLRFAQKKRNTFLSAAADNTSGIEPLNGADPLPKDVMRYGAMAARLRKPEAEVGAEYDTQAGLDYLTNFLFDAKERDVAYARLHHWVSVRRGARGQVGSLTPTDNLLMAEIIWDLAIEALETRRAREAARQSAEVPGGHDTIFFADRFAQAFPGVRGISWFDMPIEVQVRMLKLLEDPLTFPKEAPIWWWRGPRNLYIENFKALGEDHYLMNVDELKIRRIAAVAPGSYYQSFVYVETDPMMPSGLYPGVEDAIAQMMDRGGYAYEEFGLLEDGRMVTRAEHDDGAAFIDNKLVNIIGKNELRLRYLTPYNFLIAAQGSPINNPDFDDRLEELLNGMLRGEHSIDELAKEVRRLPKRSY